jgi:hypothetical protein
MKEQATHEPTRAAFDPLQFFGQDGGNEALSKAILQPMERFWEGQKQVLGEYEKLATAMLERRRAGTEATLDAIHKMQHCKNPEEWASCCNEWLGGSFARLAYDGMDLMNESFKIWTELSLSASTGIASVIGPAPEGEAESQKSQARRGKR